VRILLGILLAVSVGCGGSPPAAASPASSPSANCTADGQNFDVKSAGGYVRHAAVYGTGPTVIIAHQSDQTRCDVLPVARWLRDNGYRAVAADLYGDWVGILTAVIEAMRARGSASVQLLGASQGGCVAMVTASQVAPPVSSVVSLGGERRIKPDFDADTAVAHSHVPLFVVTSENDGFLSGGEARALIAESASKDKSALIIPGSLHGFAMLDGPDGPRVRQTILTFLSAHALT
jgi:dienelactone hydrolase